MIIFNLLNSNKTGVHNIGSGERYTNLQIIETIEKILGYQLDLKFVEDRKGHDRAYGLLTNYTPVLQNNLTKYLTEQL
jgi:dTDP-D-glucose 4,6-dehydratase